MLPSKPPRKPPAKRAVTEDAGCKAFRSDASESFAASITASPANTLLFSSIKNGTRKPNASLLLAIFLILPLLCLRSFRLKNFSLLTRVISTVILFDVIIGQTPLIAGEPMCALTLVEICESAFGRRAVCQNVSRLCCKV